MLNSPRAAHVSFAATRNAARKRVKLKANSIRASLKDEAALAYAMLDFVGDAVLATDTGANVTYMNTVAEILTGFSRQEAQGRPLETVFRVIDVATRLKRANLAHHVMETRTPVGLHNSALLKVRGGSELAIEDAASPLLDAKGELVGALIKFHDSRCSADITARMAYMAQHDSLTGLLNRYAFEERFKQASALARRHEKKMVLLFIDLNNFKEVNDTLGHSIGDEILKSLAKRLLGCVRVTDHVCRHGGDEFVVLLSDLAAHEQAFAVVDKVRESAAELLRQQGHWATLKVSVGISLFPNDGETLEALLPHADAAMYRVKAETKRIESHLKP